jgi:dephospho-CoA kinase
MGARFSAIGHFVQRDACKRDHACNGDGLGATWSTFCHTRFRRGSTQGYKHPMTSLAFPRGAIFGLTGGIACGKSTVARIMREGGLTILDADQIAREIVMPGEPAYEAIVARFGSEICEPDGALHRPALARIVFNDPHQKRWLDACTHPRISERLQLRAAEAFKKAPEAFVGYEAALLVETGSHAFFRPLVVVSCDAVVQRVRLRERDKLTESEIDARLSAQMPIAEKVQHADYVILNNSDDFALRERTLEVITQLRAARTRST